MEKSKFYVKYPWYTHPIYDLSFARTHGQTHIDDQRETLIPRHYIKKYISDCHLLNFLPSMQMQSVKYLVYM